MARNGRADRRGEPPVHTRLVDTGAMQLKTGSLARYNIAAVLAQLVQRRSACWNYLNIVRGIVLEKIIAAMLLGVLASLTCTGVSAQAVDEVAQYIHAEMARQKIPGLALLVARHGMPVRTEGYGLADVELNVPVTPETLFQSGSMGKQFTASGVMLLVEDGKLALDDPLSKFFPQGPAWWRQVTVRELLSHTAGFTDYPKDFDLRKDYTEGQLLKIVGAIPPAYPPGTSWSYSNLGYLTLGILIHQVTGEFYGDFLQRRLFKPLKMSSVRIISEADIIPHRASGYRLLNGQLKNQEWVAPTVNTTADGSLYFSIVDLAKWDAALYSDEVLKDATRQQMWTVTTLRNGAPNSGHYGLGWFVESKGGHRVVEHEGQWQGFETQISRYLDEGLTVVVLTNLGSAEPVRIADRVAAIYLAKGPGAERAARN